MTKGIVLSSTKYSESDHIVNVLSVEHQIISSRLANSRKSKKGRNQASFLGSIVDVSKSKYKNGTDNFDIVCTNAVVIVDIWEMSLIQSLCATLAAVYKFENVEQKFFDSLIFFMENFNYFSKLKKIQGFIYILANLVFSNGTFFSIEKCHQCEEKKSEGAISFDGNFFCLDCCNDFNLPGNNITLNQRKALLLTLKLNLVNFLAINIESNDLKNSLDLLIAHIENLDIFETRLLNKVRLF